ncbi:MAG: sigma-70 family RNA polymerase sigma factor [Solirubrobacteraceae bacterium]|jgi:RNA polymerase sigma factor (sigma-70 family)|nr:sigma-70 family RNA polymerase sigma factor [Solirubrobacteraceae bacterium]MDP4672380.1 sigma-70 family RNA polymerase sigma factor [Solirubrobacteraceae bacterium]MDP4921076.1 sigma-70 family RNA polymerase sigma factor [Solirubrobacteraceae bacterium]
MEQIGYDSPPLGREASKAQLDELVIEVVKRDAASLLRLSRRHSLCADDAEDAYQRGLEIFIKHAPRLDPQRAPAWLRTVIKHEAMAVRRTRQRDLAGHEIDFDQLENDRGVSPEERALGFEQVAQSAEALQRLKPQEVRALWLRAQGNSYDEIQAETGWSRTKVNRCLYEGRRAFISRYAGIESGEECKRWEPLLSALVDGEATNEQLVELRPHLRQCGSCRGVVREMHRTSAPLAAVFPAASVAAGTQLDQASNVFIRSYEAFTTWASERSASSLVRAQIVTESAFGAAGKVTAVVAATAAAASGGAVALDQVSSGTSKAPQLARLSARAVSSSASERSRAELAQRRARQQASRRAQEAKSTAAATTPVATGTAPVAAAPAPAISSPVASAPEPSAPEPASAEMGLE